MSLIESECPLNCGYKYNYITSTECEVSNKIYSEIEFHFKFMCHLAKYNKISDYTICLSKGISLVKHNEMNEHCGTCKKKSEEFV